MSREKNAMHVGTVKWFNMARGFGFIRCDDGAIGDVFVGVRTVERSPLDSLEAGQRVAFDAELDPRGRGFRVTKLESPPR
jgi:cold shock protein